MLFHIFIEIQQTLFKNKAKTPHKIDVLTFACRKSN